MTELSYREAVRDAMREAMQTDSRVFLMGEDVGLYGGCYAVSVGLFDEFGADRVRDTPLSESGFTGAGIGAAMGVYGPEEAFDLIVLAHDGWFGAEASGAFGGGWPSLSVYQKSFSS